MGWICKKIKLPSLIGMLLTGIILGPYVLNLLDESILEISSDLRKMALIIILTFEVLCGSYQKDINHVYYQNHIIPSADPTTFKASPWDSAGFEPLRFAEDKYDFYYCGNPIGVHNRDSFKQYYVGGYLWGCDSSYCYCQNNKSVIKSCIYFTVLESGLYAKDNECVFFLGKIIEGADGKTFRETKLFCGEDKNRKYEMGHRTNQ